MAIRTSFPRLNLTPFEDRITPTAFVTDDLGLAPIAGSETIEVRRDRTATVKPTTPAPPVRHAAESSEVDFAARRPVSEEVAANNDALSVWQPASDHRAAAISDLEFLSAQIERANAL